MTITEKLEITGKGTVLVANVDTDNIGELIGQTVTYDSVGYTIKKVECSKPLMVGVAIKNPVGLVVVKNEG